MTSFIHSALKLLLAILIPLSFGALASVITLDALQGWYQTLQKPSFTPPNWIFGPVWSALYIFMGIGLNHIWSLQKSAIKTKVTLVFWVQLIVNFFWSILFFAFKSPLMALIDCAILCGLIVCMIVLLVKIRPIIGFLQIPYLLWSIFATAISFEIWRLNF